MLKEKLKKEQEEREKQEKEREEARLEEERRNMFKNQLGNSLKNKLKMKPTRVRESVRGAQALMFGSNSNENIQTGGDDAEKEAQQHILSSVMIPVTEQPREDNQEE